MAEDKSKLSRALAYGTNFLARPLGNWAKEGLNLGYPFAAIGFGVWDYLVHIAENYEPLKGKIYPDTWVKAGGAIYFSGLAVNSLVEIAMGDYSALKELPFNLLMAGSLTKDAQQAISSTGFWPAKTKSKKE